MYQLWDIEARFEQNRRQTMSVLEHARVRERIAIIEQLQLENTGLRRRIASALVALGVKIHPAAAEAITTAEAAA